MDLNTHEIGGVTLLKYAELCAAMSKTEPEQTDKHAQIALDHGVNAENWETAKTGWTAMMTNPEHAMAIQQIFMPAYQKGLEAQAGDEAPCSLEDYARIKAAMIYEKDDQGNKIDHNIVLTRNGFTQQQWNVIEYYWTPRVAIDEHGRVDSSVFNEEAANKFRALIQQHADSYAGIQR